MISPHASEHHAGAILLGAAAIVVIAISAGLIANYLLPYSLPLFASEQDLNPPVPAELTPISLDQARRRLDEPEVIFLDARSPEAFAAGHVKGALNLPPGSFHDMHASLLQEQLRAAELLICYCDSTTCGQAEHLCELLSAAGYSNVAVMPEGWEGWDQAGYPKSSGKRGRE